MIDKKQIINNFNDIGKAPFEEREIKKLLEGDKAKIYNLLGTEITLRVFDLLYTKSLARKCLGITETDENAIYIYMRRGNKYIIDGNPFTSIIINRYGEDYYFNKSKHRASSSVEDETVIDGINKHSYNLAQELIHLEDSTFASMLHLYCSNNHFCARKHIDDFNIFLQSDIFNKTLESMEISSGKTSITLLFNSQDLSEFATSIYRCKNIEKYNDTEMQLTNVFCKINPFIIMGSPYISQGSMFILDCPKMVGAMIVDKNVKLLIIGDIFEEMVMEDNFGMLLPNEKSISRFTWK